MGALKKTGMPKELRNLTDKELIFVKEYPQDFDATRAAREAGYSHPNSMGSRLLAKPKISRAIRYLVKPKLDEVDLNTDRILRQLQNFLFADIAEFMDRDGDLMCHPKDLPPHLRQCIDGWDFDIVYDKDGNILKEKWRIKMVSKAVVLNMAMKYANLFPTNNNVVNVGIQVDGKEFWQNFYERSDTPAQNVVDGELRKQVEYTDDDE